ncbi:MAG TPA: hypothetical protein DCQ26_13115 [Marinilabiliales bacterium]|nr:MAG: hypothetical protein A2W95_02790 [Bacteroidetes bacterium GWA2_40_14]OFX62727.1 MAG: hypothetical protein A2W84_15600 [Bacteroidetes bacterium GWC2_40_13]OFX72004.1 MAG: hypothetical protein A2W96_08210 [Bacteroidetes bacterium GWD2_40_43]OFX89609.1 MAG: hypothetical protein A2W97_12790 [Bacteroidetes bacterium GWE2_40_63]OFY24128.1 MAG: hypothetical protein A2W88_14225 [Bacteroidetes bacterium GWF2_40_13]OFZ26320.1 MAG: hypothetical protein A2437_03140 [Bacteroidetes bacterium RIFOXYC
MVFIEFNEVINEVFNKWGQVFQIINEFDSCCLKTRAWDYEFSVGFVIFGKLDFQLKFYTHG